MAGTALSSDLGGGGGKECLRRTVASTNQTIRVVHRGEKTEAVGTRFPFWVADGDLFFSPFENKQKVLWEASSLLEFGGGGVRTALIEQGPLLGHWRKQRRLRSGAWDLTPASRQLQPRMSASWARSLCTQSKHVTRGGRPCTSGLQVQCAGNGLADSWNHRYINYSEGKSKLQ